MFNRKFSSNIRKKKRMIILSIILLVMFLSAGYAAFSTSLGINGTLNVSKYDHTLYGVLEKAVKQSTYAKEYTGEHQDSMVGVGTEKIYHWYATSNAASDSILNSNNVIFADHCWQMIRTTDTGGVKMIYNGEPENNQCLNTRGNHIGYVNKYNQTFSNNYYYGTGYTYDKVNNVFSLDGTITTGAIQTGQYTCKSTSATATCSSIYFVEKLSDGTSYWTYQYTGTADYSQFGTITYNFSNNSPGKVGYMYNKEYADDDISLKGTETLLIDMSISTSFWYGHSITWGNPVPNVYNLNDPYQISSAEEYPNLAGEYSFASTNSTTTSYRIQYIAGVSGNKMYYILLSDGHDISYYNDKYTYGDSYTDNGNGTYTINNPMVFNRIDYLNHYENITNKYVCKNAINNTCADMRYVTTTTPTSMTYASTTNNYKYASGFTYTNGTYKLNSNSVTFWNVFDSSNRTSLNNHHYTCWNTTGECTTISYVYHLVSSSLEYFQLYYYDLTNGKSINDILNEMLFEDNVNVEESIIKTGIDNWYKNYLLNYSSYLEDTIFCDNRIIDRLGGYNPNGGDLTDILYFNSSTSLSCPNITDRFSLNNNKAELTYPVSLLTYAESSLLGTNNNVRKSAAEYWIISPLYFDSTNTINRTITNKGKHNSAISTNSKGLRPVISLKPGTEYVSGTGSMADPYIVE